MNTFCVISTGKSANWESSMPTCVTPLSMGKRLRNRLWRPFPPVPASRLDYPSIPPKTYQPDTLQYATSHSKPGGFVRTKSRGPNSIKDAQHSFRARSLLLTSLGPTAPRQPATERLAIPRRAMRRPAKRHMATSPFLGPYLFDCLLWREHYVRYA